MLQVVFALCLALASEGIAKDMPTPEGTSSAQKNKTVHSRKKTNTNSAKKRPKASTRVTHPDDFQKYRKLIATTVTEQSIKRQNYLEAIATRLHKKYGVLVTLKNLDRTNLESPDDATSAYGQLAQIEDALIDLGFDKENSLGKMGIQIVAYDNVAKLSKYVIKDDKLHLDNFDQIQVFPFATATLSGKDDHMGRFVDRDAREAPGTAITCLAGACFDLVSLPVRGAHTLSKQMFDDHENDNYSGALLTQIPSHTIAEGLNRILDKKAKQAERKTRKSTESMPNSSRVR